MVFITTTAEPLSAFLMTISGLSLRFLRPFFFDRLLCFEYLGLVLNISCLTGIWNMSRALFGGLGLQLEFCLNVFVVLY